MAATAVDAHNFVLPIRPTPSSAPTVPGERRGSNITPAATFLDSLVDLIPAPLPAVTFTSLANLSVAGLCDKCQIVIDDEGLAVYLIERPLPAADDPRLRKPRRSPASTPDTREAAGPLSIRTKFRGRWIDGEPEFEGLAIHSWTTGHNPTNVDAALIQTAVDQAIALIHGERMAARAWLEASLDDTPTGTTRAGRARRSDRRTRPASSGHLRLVL